jgi:hypothetical protein
LCDLYFKVSLATKSIVRTTLCVVGPWHLAESSQVEKVLKEQVNE